MKFEHAQVMNFEGAFRGMRNPKESHHLSDSFFGIISDEDMDDFEIAKEWIRYNHDEQEDNFDNEIDDKAEWLRKNGILKSDNYFHYMEVAYIGPKDMKLAQQLIRAGSEHRKFMRQVFVCVDITAPLYWWKEADTYKVGTAANSESTMHKLATTPILLSHFETNDMNNIPLGFDCGSNKIFNEYISMLERLRLKFLETRDQKIWKELIRLLPESWLQKRTVTLTYENLYSIYRQRKNHKLIEWSQLFMNWIKELPYAEELIMIE